MKLGNIKQLAYELYKLDWERRITTDRKMDFLKNLYQDGIGSSDVEEVLADTGYDGECYVCYEEFLNSEYLEREYMKRLFGNTELFEEYIKDLAEDPDRKNATPNALPALETVETEIGVLTVDKNRDPGYPGFDIFITPKGGTVLIPLVSVEVPEGERAACIYTYEEPTSEEWQQKLIVTENALSEAVWLMEGTDDTEEIAYQYGGFYITIQRTEDGYDYSVYNMEYRLIDGGVIENPDLKMREVFGEITADMKPSVVEPVDYEDLLEKVTEVGQLEIAAVQAGLKTTA